MLITFTSKHSPDVVMFGDVAALLLRGMGVSETPPGILRDEDIRNAADKLRHFLQSLPEDDDQDAADRNTSDKEREGDSDDSPPRISLDQRALPLLELLDTAYREQDEVIWC